MFLMLVLFFSISAVQANEINTTDSQTLNLDEDIHIQLENTTPFEKLESVDSNNLSANNDYAILNDNNKNQTEIKSPTTGIYLNGCFNVILKDANANTTLPNKPVNFIINNVNYSAVTDNDGLASIKLNLKPGNYKVTAYFAGDDIYDASDNLTSTVKIIPTIKTKNISKYYKGSTKYVATFLDSWGKVLTNTLVKVTVNGKAYSKKTNNKGVVSMPVNLKPGTYKVISTNPITGYKITTTVKILSTINSKNLNKVLGDNRKFVAKFLKSNGKALNNQYVKLKINGKIYNVKTNFKGQAVLSFNNFKQGIYKVISYNKDGLSKTNTVKLFNIANTKLTSHFYTILPTDKNKEIKIELSTSLGGNSNSGKIIKIKINGKTYYRKTDGDGVAHLNVASFKKGYYAVEYDFDGNKFFKPSKAKNFVTILDGTKTSFVVKSTTKFGYGAGTQLKVAFMAGGVPLAKRTMTLSIAGKNYTRITDDKGIVFIPINQKIGKYNVVCKTYKQYKIDGNSKSFQITVFKRSLPKLAWKSGSVYKDYSQFFKVLLTDSKGKGINGGNIVLSIDSNNRFAKTSSNGYAGFRTSVAIGKYKVSFKFTGNNEYLPCSASKYINVKLSKFGAGLNEAKGASSSAYLYSSSHCPVNNAKIKALVKSLTRGLTDKIDKAKSLFNYVRDNVSYSYYYDSKLGAVGALNAKTGNCVDQAHLLVSMYRTAGFKARYVHGTCLFADGIFGHVWTQVLIGNTWVCGDPINHKNSLGKVLYWNTNSYKLNGRYASLPF